VKATIETLHLGDINNVFDRLKKGQINGRVVLDIQGKNARETGDHVGRELVRTTS
jgi:hypothetical protein